MTSGIASKGVDLDSIFDPYQAGTTKARAAGIAVAGSDTSNRFANIIYGTAAAATGIQSEGADLNTLYAAKGTAAYPLLGSAYSAEFAGRNNISLTFTSTSAWGITTNGSWNGTQPPLSGSLDTYGTVTEFMVHIVSSGTSPATWTGATPDVWTPISSGLLVAKYDTVTLAGQQTTGTFKLSLRNASGQVLSVSTTDFTVHNTNPA